MNCLTKICPLLACAVVFAACGSSPAPSSQRSEPTVDARKFSLTSPATAELDAARLAPGALKAVDAATGAVVFAEEAYRIDVPSPLADIALAFDLPLSSQPSTAVRFVALDAAGALIDPLTFEAFAADLASTPPRLTGRVRLSLPATVAVVMRAEATP